MTSADAVFVEVGPEGGYALPCAGLTVLERALREARKRGVTRALIAADRIPMRPDLPVTVEWVGRDAVAPAGMTVIRGDEAGGVPIRDAASIREAERVLVNSLGKGHQGPVDAAFNSIFSKRLVLWFTRTPIRPNHITVAATVVGLVAAGILLGGTWQAYALGGTLLQVQSIMDSCDGELARLAHLGSKLGMWLDTLTDGVVDNAFVACASIAAGGWWQTIGLALTGARVLVELYVYVDVYKRTGTPEQAQFRLWYERADATPQDVYDRRTAQYWVRSAGRRDVFVIWFWLWCLAGVPAGVVFYASVMNAITVVLVSVHIVMKRFTARR